jgi:hypothetical protein
VTYKNPLPNPLPLWVHRSQIKMTILGFLTPGMPMASKDKTFWLNVGLSDMILIPQIYEFGIYTMTGYLTKIN